jgi:hypothetical protein
MNRPSISTARRAAGSRLSTGARSLIIAMTVVAALVVAIWMGGGWLWAKFLEMHSPH